MVYTYMHPLRNAPLKNHIYYYISPFGPIPFTMVHLLPLPNMERAMYPF